MCACPGFDSRSLVLISDYETAVIYNIIILEDDRLIAVQMADMLRLLGHVVVIMFSPRTAIHQLSEVVPDIIFVDINLPGVDGFEVCRYVRRDPSLSHLPIVIVSSHDDEFHRSLAVRVGGRSLSEQACHGGSTAGYAGCGTQTRQSIIQVRQKYQPSAIQAVWSV